MQRTSTKAAVSWIALVAFISLSKPANLPSWGLIVPFILLYFAMRFTVGLAVETKGQVNPHFHAVVRWLPVVVALSVVVILALQSIGQLSTRDVIAVVLLVLLGYFYVHRNGSNQKNKNLHR